MMWGFRHLDTLEARTTRVQYLRALLDFTRWCCANLPRQQTARVKGDGVLEHEDEIGRYIDEDMGDQWHTAKGDLQWMHGPRVNATRIRAYILSIARQHGIAKAEELNPDVRVQPLKPTTVSMALIRIKALQTTCKVEGTLFGVKELHLMYDISEELANDGVPRSDIADLGHWALDKLAKSYITTIPKATVLRKAGYTGKRGDYHLGRSMVKPDDKVVALIAQHIIPWAEAELTKSSKLCRDPDFQKWAKDVNRVDLETIATRSTPSENPQEEFSAQVDAEYQVDQLNMMLHRQREDAAIEKLEMQKKLEEKDAEIAKLMQALKLAEARPMPTTPALSRPMTAAEKAASVKIEKEQDDDLTYEVNVVHPWRTSKTVEAAWRWWNNPSNFDSRPLRERYDEHRFLVRHTRMICKVEKGDKSAASAKSVKSSRPTTEVGETGKNDALQHCTRRMRRIMEAVRDLRRSDDAADTAAVIKLLDHLGRAGLSTFSDALLVLRATPPIKIPTTTDGKSVGIKGLDKPLARKLAVAWGVVTAGYMDAD
ncbi:unnamed protein product [Closterium sp. NIES-65]|nr:unnamed protein product [Closterium sp. NIES-65]